jgi:hypothetical protein
MAAVVKETSASESQPTASNQGELTSSNAGRQLGKIPPVELWSEFD